MASKLNAVGEGSSAIPLYKATAIRVKSSRNMLARLLNLILYLNGCMLLGTGLLMVWRLPPRSGPGTVMGFTRHEWGDFHMYLGLCFATLILIHLVLHRNWLIKVASGGKGWRLVLGLLVGALLIGLPLLMP